MPRVSKARPLSPQKKSLFLDDFWSAITSLKSKKETIAFFKDILTAEERLMLAKRFQIAMMLALDYSWEEIDEYVKVTQGTIAATKWRMDGGIGGLAKVANRIIGIKRSILEKRRKKKSYAPKTFGSELLKTAVSLALTSGIQELRRRKKKTSISNT